MATATKISRPYEDDDSRINSLSLKRALEYCLDVLKVKQDYDSHRSIAEFMNQTVANVPSAMIKTHGIWITAMKLIADCNGTLNCNSNDNDDHVFSQIQLYDFLALATKIIEEQQRWAIDNKIVLKILRDIMENYNNFSNDLKSNYPGIIVDVISILRKGMDTKGVRVNPISIEKYYQSRKQQAAMVKEEEKDKGKTPATATLPTTAASVHNDKILPPKNDLIESLAQITKRQREELEESLARLQYSDLKKISELCRNYSKLLHYSKLITKEDSQEEFRREIQRELGRKLRSHQLGRAINSVRRSQTYIENILDNKFIPDVSHGINHVKHNLEYGYQIMNLIERARRSSAP